MSRQLSVLILACLLTACRPPAYVQPSENEPHAILKVRHIVHQRAGPLYASDVRLGRFSIDERTLDPGASDGATIHLRIRPEVAPLQIGGRSYHQTQQLQTRYRTVHETYSCSQYSCTGYGTSRNCGTHFSTCTRSRQEAYQTWVTVDVIDDACTAVTNLAPRQDGVYLLQFDYLGGNQCTMSCYEQVRTIDGQFQLTECPLAPVQASR